MRQQREGQDYGVWTPKSSGRRRVCACAPVLHVYLLLKQTWILKVKWQRSSQSTIWRSMRCLCQSALKRCMLGNCDGLLNPWLMPVHPLLRFSGESMASSTPTWKSLLQRQIEEPSRWLDRSHTTRPWLDDFEREWSRAIAHQNTRRLYYSCHAQPESPIRTQGRTKDSSGL